MMKFATLNSDGRKGGTEVGFKVGRFALCRIWFSMEALAICAVLLGGGVQRVGASQQTATIHHINVTGDDHGPGIEIRANQPMTPRTQTLTGPDRLIIDLPGARPAAGLEKIAVNRGKVRDVRVGLLSANPPTTRVVLDLVEPEDYQVSPVANTIVIKLGNQAKPGSGPVAPRTNPPAAEVRSSGTTAAVPVPQLEQPTERNRLRWIMPILVTTSIVAMLVIALVVNIQNRRSRRGH